MNMKKIFYSLMIVLIGVCFASCEEQPITNETGAIKITITDIKATAATASCKPDDASKRYLFLCCKKAEFDSVGIQNMGNHIKESADLTIKMSDLSSYDDLAASGDMWVPLTMLTPNSQYVFSAVYFDINTAQPEKEISYTVFSTKSEE